MKKFKASKKAVNKVTIGYFEGESAPIHNSRRNAKLITIPASTVLEIDNKVRKTHPEIDNEIIGIQCQLHYCRNLKEYLKKQSIKYNSMLIVRDEWNEYQDFDAIIDNGDKCYHDSWNQVGLKISFLEIVVGSTSADDLWIYNVDTDCPCCKGKQIAREQEFENTLCYLQDEDHEIIYRIELESPAAKP